MPTDEQAGNGSGNVCAVMGCEGGDLFRLDIMGQPTTAYLCGDHVGFVRQFSLTMPNDEQAGNGSIWVKVDMPMASGADGVIVEAFPVVRMGGFSPAYYPAGPDDEPDAYVFLLP